MRVRSLVRDLVLVAFAVTVGWWMRGADKPVFAQRGGSGPENLAFQMIGTGPESTLVMYNPGNHSLYVYPRAGAGNSLVGCAYSFTINSPGAPIERKNCPVADLTPQR